jgi:glycosyltransferase involved in cell wall biosynthesis
MPKILIISQFFSPESGAGARRVKTMAEVLAKEHDVCVIAPEPSYPTPEKYKHFDIIGLDRDFPGKIIRGNAFRPYHPSLIIRALREILMAWDLVRNGISIQPDLVIVSTPSIFLAPFAWALARFKGLKFVYDLRDITWRYARETANPSKFMIWLSILLEKFVAFFLRHSDLTSCATSGMADILENEYQVPKKKIITIMNGVSDDMLTLGKRNDLNIDAEKPVVSYIGVFGYNQGMGIMLDVAKQLPSVKFQLIGDGPEKDRIRERVAQEKISNVDVVGFVTSAQELSRYYHRSTILFSHIKKTPVLKATMIPAKIFEYMAFGKPIIFAGQGITVDFLEGIGCAVTVPPEDPFAIVDAILHLIQKPNLMARMGQNGQVYVEKNFRRCMLMKKLLEELDARFGF